MVGVPGRSKACATCRRRRKGCDLQRPVCGQCKTAKLPCGDWDRERIFINADQKNAVVPLRYKPPLTPAATSSKSSSASSSSTSSPAPSREASVREKALIRAAARTPPTLHDSLAQTSYQSRYLEKFLNVYLPLKRESWNQTYLDAIWVTMAVEMYRMDDTVRRALFAHAFATLAETGRGECDPEHDRRWLLNESFRFYAAALEGVQATLSDSRQRKDDGLVAASRVLCSYEMLYGHNHTNPDKGDNHARSWHSYNLGDEALILQRTPEEYVEGIPHRIYISGRHQLIISSIMRRKRSFLSDRVWKTVPFQKYGKSPKQHLLDVMADVPWLLEMGDYLESHPSSTNYFQKFLLLYRFIDRGLAAWFNREPPPMTNEELDALGSKTVEITDMDIYIGELMCQYWTACLLVYSMLHLTIHRCSPFFDVQPFVSKFVDMAPRTNPRPYATRIARMLKLFFQPEAGEMATKPAALPIGVSLAYLRAVDEEDSEDSRMMHEVLQSTERGKTLGKFIYRSAGEWRYPGEEKLGANRRAQYQRMSDTGVPVGVQSDPVLL